MVVGGSDSELDLAPLFPFSLQIMIRKKKCGKVEILPCVFEVVYFVCHHYLDSIEVE